VLQMPHKNQKRAALWRRVAEVSYAFAPPKSQRGTPKCLI